MPIIQPYLPIQAMAMIRTQDKKSSIEPLTPKALGHLPYMPHPGIREKILWPPRRVDFFLFPVIYASNAKE
jgi:hypothetical protein